MRRLYLNTTSPSEERALWFCALKLGDPALLFRWDKHTKQRLVTVVVKHPNGAVCVACDADDKGPAGKWEMDHVGHKSGKKGGYRLLPPTQANIDKGDLHDAKVEVAYHIDQACKAYGALKADLDRAQVDELLDIVLDLTDALGGVP